MAAMARMRRSYIRRSEEEVEGATMKLMPLPVVHGNVCPLLCLYVYVNHLLRVIYFHPSFP